MCDTKFTIILNIFMNFPRKPYIKNKICFQYPKQFFFLIIGPSHWGEKYSTCVGKHQSPIDISEKYISLVKLDPLFFENFDEVPIEASLTNNGHTGNKLQYYYLYLYKKNNVSVMYKIISEVMPELSGGPLRGVYRFEQLHFHWGENDNEGSENTINNSRYIKQTI